MKKYGRFVGLFSILFLSATAAMGNFYAGLGLSSPKPAKSDVHISSSDSVPGYTGFGKTHSTRNRSALMRFLGGYQKEWDKIMVATEIFGQSKETKQNINRFGVSTAGEVPIDNLNISVKRNYTAGGTLKIGRYVTDHLGIYLSAGAVNSQFQTTVASVQVPTSVTSSQNQNVWGGVFGGGFFGHIGEFLVLKAEYGYEYYKRFSTHPLQSSFSRGLANVTNVISPKMSYHSLTISVAYLI